MSLDNYCPLCQCCPKSILHLFLRCDFARPVWFFSPLGHRVPEALGFLSWLEKGLDVDDVWDVQSLCITLWAIWNARSHLVFRNEQVSPGWMARVPEDLVANFNRVNPRLKYKKKMVLPENRGNATKAIIWFRWMQEGFRMERYRLVAWSKIMKKMLFGSLCH